MNPPIRLVAAAVLGVLAIGSALLLLSPPQAQVGNPSESPAGSLTPSASSDATRTGLILLEHFGANAPDGSGLASGPNGRSLWLISADGTGLRELSPGQPGDGKTNAVWSRDGMHIAFETVDPRRVVYETDVAGRALQKVGHELCSGFVEGSNPCAEGGPAYSPDGNDLATVLLVRDGSFSTPVRDRTTQHVIYIRHRYESNESCSRSDTCFHLGFPLDATQVATSTAWIEGLSWSPDGTKIAYYRVAKDADGKPLGSELWIVNADGTDAHPIPLPAGLSAGDPDWSPDGSLIVFSSQPIHDWDEVGVSGTPDVYTVRPDGTDLKRLTHDHGSGAPSWTSDGKILFYSQRALWLMDADGSNATPVFPNGPTLWGEATGWSYYGYSQPMP